MIRAHQTKRGPRRGRDLLVASLLLAGFLTNCSTDSPTAPVQQGLPNDGAPSAFWAIKVNVSPDVVEMDSGDPVTVSVDVRRADNNLAPASGTTIILSTSLGDFQAPGSGTSSIVLVTVNGRAQTLVFAGGVKGTALLTAQLESSAGQSTFLIREAVVPVVAGFSFQNSESNLSVQFQDTSTEDPTRWRWDFGDGQTSTEQNPVNIYALPGDYVVTLTASNSDSSDTTSQLINVTRDPEFIVEAGFTATADGLTIVFQDTSTGNPNRWKWSFGDGTSSSQQHPTKTYRREGSYVVTLTASNSQSSDDTSQTVTVGLDPLGIVAAGFQTNITDRTVTFLDTSAGEPTNWDWDFGDGTGSTAQNPTHTYGAGGSFVVTLTASNRVSSDTFSTIVTLEGDQFFITAVAPNKGPEAGGTPVTISGTGFVSPLRVFFGGVLATTVSVSPTAVVVTTPPFNVPDGVNAPDCIAVDVTVELGGGTVGTVTGGFTYFEPLSSCS